MVVGISWGIGFSQGGENIQRRAAPHQHAQTAKQSAIYQCAGRQGRDLAECVEEQIQTAEETARAEQDLTAQQQAAWGSMLSALWSGIALFVTGIGTILLYQQIVLTRQAVEETSNATGAMIAQNELTKVALQIENRGWLKIDVIEQAQLGQGFSRFQCQIKNVGKGVCQNIKMYFAIDYIVQKFPAVNSPWDGEVEMWPNPLPNMIIPGDVEIFDIWATYRGDCDLANTEFEAVILVCEARYETSGLPLEHQHRSRTFREARDLIESDRLTPPHRDMREEIIWKRTNIWPDEIS